MKPCTMIKTYPVILTPDTGGYVVSVPDLDINTQGDDLAEALYMARDAIGEWGICQQNAGRPIPEPSKTEPVHASSEFVSWLDIDFEEYRRASEMIPNAETIAAMEEADRISRDPHIKGYTDVDEMMRVLLADG